MWSISRSPMALKHAVGPVQDLQALSWFLLRARLSEENNAKPECYYQCESPRNFESVTIYR